MGIDLSVLATNANKLDKYINKNEKQEQDRKDNQLYYIVERKVKKEQHKREKPRGRDGTLKECKRLFEEGASPEVLIKLEESLREQEKHYRYYVQCFLPVLGKVIKQSNKTKEQVKLAISEVTQICFSKSHRYSESESGYGSDFEDEVNEIMDNDAQLLKAIKNGNNRKFRKYLKNCTNISGIKDEKGNNILHLIASLEKKQKLKFLDTLIKTSTKKNLAQLVDSENQEGKTPFQLALIDKVTKEKHESSTTRSSDNTLKFLITLLEYGINSDRLESSKEVLQSLKEEQKTYYCDFLEKLAKSVKKPELKSEIRTKIKEIVAHTVNTPNSNSDYLLHLAIKNKDEKSFKELLQKGADINLKDTNGNNALHLIVKPETKQKLELLNILLEASQKEQFIKAVNDKKEGQTPLHQLLQYIRKKSESHLLTDKEFKGTTRYQILELFLQNGADITAQDKEGNNTLHYMASFKGKHRTICLRLISGKDDAVNTTNREGLTPLHQLFQHIKEKNEDRSCTDKKFEKTNRYKDLELFLQNDADITAQDKEGNNALHQIALLKGEQKISCLNLILDLVEKGVISSEKLHKAINAKNEDDKHPAQVALIRQANKIPSKLKDFSRWSRLRSTKHYYTAEFCAILLQNGAENKSDHITIPEKHYKEKYYQTTKRIKDLTGISLPLETQEELEERFSKKNAHKNINLPVGWILGGLIFATVFCALAGNMIAAAALSVTIAVCAMCYPVYLKLENAFNAKNSTAQELSNQSEYTESPATQMSDVSILRQFINKLDGLTNKFSFPGR